MQRWDFFFILFFALHRTLSSNHTRNSEACRLVRGVRDGLQQLDWGSQDPQLLKMCLLLVDSETTALKAYVTLASPLLSTVSCSGYSHCVCEELALG